MNKADRFTVARVIAAADEDGWTCPDLERLRKVLEAHGTYVVSPERRAQIAKRPKGNPIPQASRQALLERSRGWCEANTPACGEVLLHRADHAHHLAGRTDHSLDNLLHVCHRAHAYIHANPLHSYQAGWMRKRNGVQQ